MKQNSFADMRGSPLSPTTISGVLPAATIFATKPCGSRRGALGRGLPLASLSGGSPSLLVLFFFSFFFLAASQPE